MEINMIAVTVFLLIMNQTEFLLVHILIRKTVPTIIFLPIRKEYENYLHCSELGCFLFLFLGKKFRGVHGKRFWVKSPPNISPPVKSPRSKT